MADKNERGGETKHNPGSFPDRHAQGAALPDGEQRHPGMGQEGADKQHGADCRMPRLQQVALTLDHGVYGNQTQGMIDQMAGYK